MLAGAAGLLACVELSTAGVQESVSYSGVNSVDVLNNASNVTQAAMMTGGYPVKSIHISASGSRLSNRGSTSNQLTEARILVTPPAGSGGIPFVIQPLSPSTTITDDLTVNDEVFPLADPVTNAAGTWSFQFFEITNNATGADHIWNSITITLDDDAAAISATATTILPTGSPGSATYTATGTGNNDASATLFVADGLNAGDKLFQGFGRLLNWRVSTAMDAPAIYRYTFTMTPPGNILSGPFTSLRGFTQNPTGAVSPAGSSGYVSLGSFVSFQDPTDPSGNTVTNSSTHINKWYGFGKGERVLYRLGVNGTSSSNCNAVLSRETITPAALSGALMPGSVSFTLTSAAAGDMWLYDANFNAVANAGFEGTGSLTRTLAAGTYYLAISNRNLGNEHASPTDSGVLNGNVLYGAGGVAHDKDAVALPVDLSVTVTHGGGTATGSASRVGRFDVAWYVVIVGGAATGACCDAGGACTSAAQASCAGSYQGDNSVCMPNPCPQPQVGVCCQSNGSCAAATPGIPNASCSSGTLVVNGTCSPNTCPQPGVCCRGATCNAAVSQANCVGDALAGAAFVAAAACNSGSTSVPCCYADYNKTGGVTVGDIFDYLNSWFGGSVFAKVGGDGTAGTLQVQDIFDFLNAWFAGC
jgi:hypothetical protein